MKLPAVKFAVLLGMLAIGSSSPAQQAHTYTTDADFDKGRLEGVNHNAPNNNQLQISFDQPPFIDKYLWVANFAQETVTKIDTQTGNQVGKYHSALMRNWDGSIPTVPTIGSGCNSPSRTTVDGDGNAFVANRGLCNGTGAYSIASLTKIAGTLGQCVDRNGNGRIDTSHDANNNKIIDPAEVLGQSDECLLWTKNYTAPGDLGRSVAVDADQNLWVGGYDTSKLYKLDGKTGALLQKIDPNAETGITANIYGLAIGPDGFIYTSDLTARQLRKIDPKAPAGKHVLATIESPVPTYGIAVDPKGIVWLGNYSTIRNGGVVRVDFIKGTAELMSIPTTGDCTGYTRGIAVDHKGNIWTACWSSNRLLQFNSAGVFLKSIPTDLGPLGVTLDYKHRVWTANQSGDSVTLYDPIEARVTQSSPAGGPPYSYWDLTGYQFLNSTVARSRWTVEHDSGKNGTKWGTIHWNREPAGKTPPGTTLNVRARADDDLTKLDSKSLVEVTRGQSFAQAGVMGRYLQIQVQFIAGRKVESNISPVLSDLTMRPSLAWHTLSLIGSEPQGHRAVLLKDGQVFIVGGYTRVAHIYNPSTDTWRSTTSAPTVRRNHTATLLKDGRVLVTGGAGGTLDATAALYNPANATWAPAAPMGQARVQHTATLLADGRVLVVGGTAPGLRATAELYDPVANTWVSTGNLNQSRQEHTATLLENGHVLVVGGINDSNTSLASAEVYNPNSRTWTLTAPLKQTRHEHTATLLKDNRVIVTGNKNNSSNANTSELYDPQTNTWISGPNMTRPRARHQATLLQTGQVLVSGGYHDSGPVQDTTELYDPVTGTWEVTGSMLMPRRSHSLILLDNGEVLATGGIGGNGNTGGQNSSELFSP